MRVLFADLLRPNLDQKKDRGGTHWGELCKLVKTYNSCPLNWIQLGTGDIRRRRQLDKYEPIITYYVFAALALGTASFKDIDCVRPVLRRGYADTHVADQLAQLLCDVGWEGLKFEASLAASRRIRRAVAHKVGMCPIPYVREIARAKSRVRFEGATHLDVFFGDPRGLKSGAKTLALGIEAKFTSDIDIQTTYSPHRNQIIRNVEGGNSQFASFAFLLVAPRAYREHKSRFYVYKMKEYLGPDGVSAMRRDAVIDPGPDAAADWQRRMGWLDWEDLISIAFPGGKPRFRHDDTHELIEMLKSRLLWPWGKDAV